MNLPTRVPASTVVRTDVGADNTIAIVQCGGTDTAGTGLALSGGAKSNESSDNNPFFELSAPAEADGSEARLEVRDHGPGLPDADPGALFERFWRAEGGRERGRGGAGLGLAIVAAIAPGGGASFVVALPAARTLS